MKYLLRIALLLLVIGCQKDELVLSPEVNLEPVKKLTKTSLTNEAHLESVLSTIGFTQVGSTNGRVNEDGVEIDTENILKVVQSDSAHHTYTFNINNDLEQNSTFFLVIEELNNGYLGLYSSVWFNCRVYRYG